MTAKDLISKGKATVRQSANLYALYKSLFFEAFGREPVCPTCGSPEGAKDWQAFGAYAQGIDPNNINLNIINMSDNQKKDFAVKVKSKIYKFIRTNKLGKSQLVRQYGDVMTADFANEYLEGAENDPVLFKQRSSEFSILPEKFRDIKKVDAPVVDAPIVDAPIVDAPVVDAPVVDAPVVDAPVVGKLPTTLKGLKEYAAEKQYPEVEYAEIKTIKDMTLYVETKALTGEEDLLS